MEVRGNEREHEGDDDAGTPGHADAQSNATPRASPSPEPLDHLRTAHLCAPHLIVLPRVVTSAYNQPDRTVERRIDYLGAVLVTGGCLAIVYGAVSAADDGWSSAKVVTSIALGIVLLAVFVLAQNRVAAPLMPLRFFNERTRVAANIVTIFFYSVFFTQFFITTLFLQNVRGFSALRAGLSFLPFGLTLGVAIGIATALQPRIGTKPLLAGGVLLSGIAMLLFTRITADGSFAGQILPASFVIAFGSGLCLPSLSNAAVHRVTGQDAGLASGLQQARRADFAKVSTSKSVAPSGSPH